MAELQQNRYDQLLRRVGGLIGPGSMVGETIGELFPMIDVERVPIELLGLSGTRVAWATSTFNALAANLNHHQLFNPVDSGHLVVITTLLIRNSVSQLFRMGVNDTPLTDDIGNVQLRDTRLGITARAVAQNRGVQQVGGIAANMQFQVETAVNLEISDQNGIAVLFPGTGLRIATTNVNTGSTVGWWWRERAFQPSEANF